MRQVFLFLLWLSLAAACAPAAQAPAPTATPPPPPPRTPTATAAPTGTPTPVFIYTPLPTWTPTVNPEVRLEVLSYSIYRASNSWVYVAGAAVNRGTAPSGEVRIAVSLLDAKGNVATVGASNEAHVEYVPPGGRYPFLVILPTAPPQWKDVNIQFEAKLYQPEQLYKPYWNLQVDKVVGQPPQGAYIGFGYSGSVRNTGLKRARMVQVSAIAYDAADKVIDVGSGYVPFEYLNAGQDAAFEFRFKNVRSAPARYEMLAEGHLTE